MARRPIERRHRPPGQPKRPAIQALRQRTSHSGKPDCSGRCPGGCAGNPVRDRGHLRAGRACDPCDQYFSAVAATAGARPSRVERRGHQRDSGVSARLLSDPAGGWSALGPFRPQHTGTCWPRRRGHWHDLVRLRAGSDRLPDRPGCPGVRCGRRRRAGARNRARSLRRQQAGAGDVLHHHLHGRRARLFAAARRRARPFPRLALGVPVGRRLHRLCYGGICDLRRRNHPDTGALDIAARGRALIFRLAARIRGFTHRQPPLRC